MNIIPSFFKSGPLKIYLWFFILLSVFSLIGIPLLSIGHFGGEQRPLILLSYVVDTAFYGFFILAVLSSFIYLKWFKRYWYINVLIILITGYPIARVHFQKSNRNNYDESQETELAGNNEIVIKKEYYPNTQIIRSVKYFINGKKDSTWVVYSKDGKILEKKKYKNDIPISETEH